MGGSFVGSAAAAARRLATCCSRVAATFLNCAARAPGVSRQPTTNAVSPATSAARRNALAALGVFPVLDGLAAFQRGGLDDFARVRVDSGEKIIARYGLL